LETFKAALLELSSPDEPFFKTIVEGGKAAELWQYTIFDPDKTTNAGEQQQVTRTVSPMASGVRFQEFMVLVDRLREYFIIFKGMCKDGESSISKDQICTEVFAGREKGEILTPTKTMDMLFQDLDTNEDGKLDFSEFATLHMGSMIQKCKRLSTVFRDIDTKEPHDWMDETELEKALQQLKMYGVATHSKLQQMHEIWPSLIKGDAGNGEPDQMINFATFVQVIDNLGDLRASTGHHSEVPEVHIDESNTGEGASM